MKSDAPEPDRNQETLVRHGLVMRRGSLILSGILVVLLCVLSFLIGMIVRGKPPLPGDRDAGDRIERSNEPSRDGTTLDPSRGMRVRVLACGRTDADLTHAMEVIEHFRGQAFPDVDWEESNGDVIVYVGHFDRPDEATGWLAEVRGMRYAGSYPFRDAQLVVDVR